MQTLLTLKASALGVSACLTLAACGGGGGGALVQDAVPFQDTTSIDVSTLTALSLNAADASVASETGSLDRAGNTLSFGGLSGTVAADRASVALADGAVTFEGGADAAAVRFDAAQGSVTTSGIIGVATDQAALPSGSATYTGDTVITAISDRDVFELDGTATIAADFGAATPNVTTTLSGLSGSRQPVLGDAEAVADAGTLTITGSTISGAGFSGGTAALTSSVLALSGSETVALEGAFFGVDATEVGGVFIIDDADVRIFGDFLGD